MGRNRHHLLVAIASVGRDMDAGDLKLVASGWHQDRRAGITAGALAGVQHKSTIAGWLAEVANAVGRHGVSAILAIARDLRARSARRRVRAQLERHDLFGQVVDQREHRPIGASSLVVLQRIVARADLVSSDARVGQMSSAAVAGEKVQRVGRYKASAARVVDAMRRSHDPVARDNHAGAGVSSAIVERADRRPRLA
jgi:hypothetical protein